MSSLHNVSESEFKSAVIDHPGLTLVDFWATWCGPCKMLAPTLEQVQKELGDAVKIVKVNIEENPNVTNQFRVQNIPYMILFKNGENVGQLVGNRPKKDIVDLINAHS